MTEGKSKRSIVEKRESVIKALKDSFWSRRSNRAIAGHIGVSHTYVANLRRELKEGAKIRMSLREYLKQARRMIRLPVGFIQRAMSSEPAKREMEQDVIDRLASQLHSVRYGAKTKLKKGTLPPPIRSRRSRRPRRLNSSRKNRHTTSKR